jgi:predicted RNA-binding protein YlxR (DUF448 family)
MYGPYFTLTKCLGARATAGSCIRAYSPSFSSSLSSNYIIIYYFNLYNQQLIVLLEQFLAARHKWTETENLIRVKQGTQGQGNLILAAQQKQTETCRWTYYQTKFGLEKKNQTKFGLQMRGMVRASIVAPLITTLKENTFPTTQA